MTPLPFNEKIDKMLERAGGRLYLANLDRPALERFVREILQDIEKELIEWRDAKDEQMKYDKFWDGYEQGMIDAIVAVRIWGQDVD
jgi:uncharacterized NAD(P)/FAD-binding protein YdhS